MNKKQQIICINCPLGCLMSVTLDVNGNISKIINNLCKNGEKYAIAECKFPGRVLTATVLTEDSGQALLPVKSDKPVPKGKLMDCMHSLVVIKLKPPIKIGQVVVHNIAGMGVDMVATDELLI
jgi:CxxC motif-containing protein